MGVRQMTFEIPDDVAEQFNSSVPVAEQSAIMAKILQRASWPGLTEDWAVACEAANNDPETQQIQREMDALGSEGLEDWVSNECDPK